MAVNDPNTPSDPANPPTSETPAATPTVDLSNFVSREEYARLEGMLTQVNQTVQHIAGGRQAAPAPVDPGPQYTDDQLAEMLESGEGRKVLEAQRYIARQQMAPFAREFVTFRDNTISTAAQFNREIAEARGTMPHASDPGVKSVMNEFLAKMPTDAHANPEVLKLAYEHAVAQPENFKRLVDREVEAELRRRAGGDDPTGTPDRGAPAGRLPASGGGDVPTVRELLGKDAADMIRSQGYRSADDWVRASQRGRYKSWKEMATAIINDPANAAPGGGDDDQYDRSLQ